MATPAREHAVKVMQGHDERSDWQEKWQQAVKELNDVKERAWTLLEEKDAQLQALKVSFDISNLVTRAQGML